MPALPPFYHNPPAAIPHYLCRCPSPAGCYPPTCPAAPPPTTAIPTWCQTCRVCGSGHTEILPTACARAHCRLPGGASTFMGQHHRPPPCMATFLPATTMHAGSRGQVPCHRRTAAAPAAHTPTTPPATGTTAWWAVPLLNPVAAPPTHVSYAAALDAARPRAGTRLARRTDGTDRMGGLRLYDGQFWANSGRAGTRRPYPTQHFHRSDAAHPGGLPHAAQRTAMACAFPTPGRVFHPSTLHSSGGDSQDLLS